MTMLKILSAGLIATTMFTTAVSARENPMNRQYAAEHAHHASIDPFAEGATSRLWMLAPTIAGHTQTPSEQPDGVCDHGDNAQVC